MYASVFNPLLAGKPHWHTRKCEAFLTYLSAKNPRRAGWLAMRTPPPFLGAGGRCRPPETGFEDVVLRPLISCGAVTAPLLAAGQPSQPHARTGRLQGCWPVAFRFVFPNRAGDRCLSSGWVPGVMRLENGDCDRQLEDATALRRVTPESMGPAVPGRYPPELTCLGSVTHPVVSESFKVTANGDFHGKNT
jgi:hypothetical protein